MLKLFSSQGNSTAVLLRACLPAAVSWHLRNTRVLKDCRRSMSNDCSQGKTDHCRRSMSDDSSQGKTDAKGRLPSEGRFHLMSLISKQGDSLLEIVNILGDNGPSFRCTGMYDEAASLVNMVDSTVFPKKSVSFFMELNKPSQAQHKSQYCLSLSGENVVAKLFNQDADNITDRERFVHLIHGSYSMFESVKCQFWFLGSYKDGSLKLIYVNDTRLPDPRTLFLTHLKLPDK